MTWPPELSARLRRRKTEPTSFDYTGQSDSSFRLCVAVGFDDDEVITSCRDHEPSRKDTPSLSPAVGKRGLRMGSRPAPTSTATTPS